MHTLTLTPLLLTLLIPLALAHPVLPLSPDPEKNTHYKSYTPYIKYADYTVYTPPHTPTQDKMKREVNKLPDAWYSKYNPYAEYGGYGAYPGGGEGEGEGKTG
ncbi:hypothetical protein P153DRAFT_386344 [Dothidotthia symphoricarpi CBS 119687]|uniref:Uncharacterized protein n=1 Tax=Dothidotthia symphoricarpi CBS 119687 TaxID=1392245 RepID=A0A6A6AFI9_9PLEO|nr:uncharacterized protein P153DRAFT_386344 [Dothidotthia symphoricarpi CBS 119687]KAF2129161.1 hypothetical protein P153DRAFT_386344 [Dothidotthia symphoricarpi CBS 119687]